MFRRLRKRGATMWRFMATRAGVERDLDDEIAAFADALTRRHVAAGVAPAEARRLALVEIGSTEALKDGVRDVVPGSQFDTWLKDLALACRTVRRHRGFAVVVVMVLALGIGANTAIFTLMDAVGWRRLPIPNPGQLYALGLAGSQVPLVGAVRTGDPPAAFTYPQFQAMRAADVADLAGYSTSAFPVPLTVTVGEEQWPAVSAAIVSGNYFPVLGLRAQAGRLLGTDDDRNPGQHPVAVISDALWRERFGGLRSAIGQHITLDGFDFTIVGVTPQGFTGLDVGRAPDAYVPMAMQEAVMPVVGDLIVRPTVNRTWIQVVTRLRTGTSAPQLAAALFPAYRDGTLLPGLPPRAPLTTAQARVTVNAIPYGVSMLRGQFVPALRVLMGLVVLLLLIACVNVANLLLARADARRAEFSVRLALGASRWRLARQLLLEGGLFGTLGGLVGWWLARLATAAAVATLRINDTAVALDVTPNTRTLLFTTVVSLLTVLTFGLVPVRYAARTDLVAALSRLTGRRDRRRFTTARALTVGQVALSLALVAGAALFTRSLQSLYRLDASIERGHLLVARVEPRGSNQRNPAGVAERLDRVYRALREEVAALPGVTSVSLANVSPTKPDSGASVLVPNHPGERLRAAAQIAYPGLFTTLGVPVMAGREFNDGDTATSAPVCIVNEAFTRLAYSQQDPIGHLCFEGGRLASHIVGVVRDVRFTNLREAPVPTIYTPYLQANTGRGQMILFVRTTVSARALVEPIADRIRRADPTVPQYPVRTLAEELDSVLARDRLLAGVSGSFGIMALIVAAVGVFGLLSFTSATRMGEFALRMVLGASPREVAALILTEAGVLLALGVAAGAALTVAAMRAGSDLLSVVVFGASPIDPVSITTATVVLLVTGGLAAYLPASRAARTPPMTTLRAEQE